MMKFRVYQFTLYHEQGSKVVGANRTSLLRQPKPEPPNSNKILSCAYNTDGTFLLVAISEILVIYNADTGSVVTKPVRVGNFLINTAKESIRCIAFAKNGKTFATAG
jgi:hypothetical protein